MWAGTLGRYPRRSTVSRTRRAVSAPMRNSPSRPRSTCETVVCEIPSVWAMSFMRTDMTGRSKRLDLVRDHVGLAVLPGQQLVGLGIAHDRLGLSVEAQRAPDPIRDVGQVRERRREMAFQHVAIQ